MSEGCPDEWRDRIAAWAVSKDHVQEVYLFGSRAKGSHKPESDVDLAIVLTGENFGQRFAYWTFETDGWENELSDLISATVDLQMADAEQDEVVWPAVSDHGQLIYRKGCDLRN